MRFWAAFIATVLCWHPFGVAAQDAVHTIPEFTFENGEKLAGMKVGYATHGKLNDAKSNAILVTHGASGIRTSNAPLIGPGKAYDTDKYFVITVDAIGGGNSSQPKDGLGPKFPKYIIRDMVRAQHDLLTKGLGLSHAVAVGGPSMGAQQALEWGIHYPDFMDGLLLIVPASRSDRHVRAIFDAVETAIKLDPKYQDGNYTAQPRDGIILGGMIYFPWLYSDEHLSTITDEATWEKTSRAFGTAWANAWDANSLLSRYQAASRFDPSTAFGGDLGKALALVKARTLIMPSMTDRTLPTYLAREIYRGIKNANATYVEIPSYLGHLAGGPANETSGEYGFVTSQIKKFLAELPPK
jgi:homoserine O-acetyltransferase/O-succinyltransferase